MGSLRELAAGFRWHDVPEGIRPRTSKLCEAVRRHGVPLPLTELYRANTVTVDELAALRLGESRARLAAYAEQQRRMRHDAWAEGAAR